MGCNEQELETFIPKMNCKNFIQAYPNWQEIRNKYIKEMKK